jgi:hypothetical protein
MRPCIPLIAATIGMVALALPSAARAISPATPEQMLCGGRPYIFVGRVLSAVSRDCRLTKSAAECGLTFTQNEVQLQVVVTRILGLRPEALGNPRSALRVGQTIDPMTEALATPYATNPYDEQGRLMFNAPYDTLLPDDRLKAAYVGREFVFAGGASRVRIWSLDKVGWAQETMAMFSRLRGAPSCHYPL